MNISGEVLAVQFAQSGFDSFLFLLLVLMRGKTTPFLFKAGDSYPFAHQNIVFEISFQPGESPDIYLRVHDEDNMELPFTLMTRERFSGFNHLLFGVILIFASISMAMTAYYFLLFLSLRDFMKCDGNHLTV